MDGQKKHWKDKGMSFNLSFDFYVTRQVSVGKLCRLYLGPDSEACEHELEINVKQLPLVFL